jgi:hypothetical protein
LAKIETLIWHNSLAKPKSNLHQESNFGKTIASSSLTNQLGKNRNLATLTSPRQEKLASNSLANQLGKK